MKPRDFRASPRQKGFTLIELMTVLAVLAVMATLAAPSFMDSRRNAGLTSITNTLVTDIYRTRSEAMKEGVPVIMEPSSNGDWKQGWRIFVDRDLNDTYAEGEKVVVTVPATEIPDYIAIENSSTKGNYVKFNGAGFPRDSSNGFGALTLTVKRTDKDGDRYIRRIILSGSGRVKSCRPDVDNGCSGS